MRVGFVVVHYHAAEEAARAIGSFHAEIARSGLEGDAIVVDNGSSAAERDALAALPARLLRPPSNLGYAGGVNLGAAATGADALVLANPDVELLPGALTALVEALAAGAGAAGPRFVWDRGGRLLLPPLERQDALSVLLHRLAIRGEPWSGRARRRWRRHARRHWRARRPLASFSLSGGLLAVSRHAWRRVGPFDDGYPLYFEETDWLLRLRRRGLAACHVPGARVVHRYARSTMDEPRSAEWFAASERRFTARHRPWWLRRALRGLADAGPAAAAAADCAAADGAPALDLAPFSGRGELWVEMSPQPEGFPAAAERLAVAPQRWRLPEEVRERLPPGVWTLRLSDARGHELACRRFRS